VPRRAATGGAALVACALVAAALVFTPRPALSSPAPAPVVNVVEHDFQITVRQARVAPGAVVFRVWNRGPDAHELIVVRADRGLPFRSDGITIDEEALRKQIAGGLEPAPAGARRTLRVRLERGRYVLLCNMYGHYMAGMHSTVIVG
jgi:uncharacterized cupredoxin-like copper-binding protein